MVTQVRSRAVYRQLMECRRAIRIGAWSEARSLARALQKSYPTAEVFQHLALAELNLQNYYAADSAIRHATGALHREYRFQLEDFVPFQHDSKSNKADIQPKSYGAVDLNERQMSRTAIAQRLSEVEQHLKHNRWEYAFSALEAVLRADFRNQRARELASQAVRSLASRRSSPNDLLKSIECYRRVQSVTQAAITAVYRQKSNGLLEVPGGTYVALRSKFDLHTGDESYFHVDRNSLKVAESYWPTMEGVSQ